MSGESTRPFPGSVTYLVRNIDACLKALPKCLQCPWGLDWLRDHLLQPLGEPGEHTAPHTARGESCQARWGWQQWRAPPAHCPQLKPKIHRGCKRSTSQTPMLMRGPRPQALRIPPSSQFLQHQQEIIKKKLLSPLCMHGRRGCGWQTSLRVPHHGAYPAHVCCPQHPWGCCPSVLAPG